MEKKCFLLAVSLKIAFSAPIFFSFSPSTLNPRPSTLDPQPSPLNPRPSVPFRTLDGQPVQTPRRGNIYIHTRPDGTSRTIVR